MSNLYSHQRAGVKFLVAHNAAMLCDEMGVGKSRQALVAAQQLFAERKIDRVLILAPDAVRISWREEMDKLQSEIPFIPCVYDVKKQFIYGARVTPATKREDWQFAGPQDIPVLVTSYALLPQDRHVKALSKWCFDGNALLICDESSFLKNRTAKQTKGSTAIASQCAYRWLLTGTPIANSPLDLYAQAIVMSPSNGNGHNYKPNGAGPLKGFGNFYHFRSRYATTQPMRFGGRTFQQVTGYQNLDELTAKFAPYVLRRTKAECLDLPAKSYVTREVQLTDATWKIYNELRKDALLALPDEDVRPEPNAAVRILRLCQLTSGHVGTQQQMTDHEEFINEEGGNSGLLIGCSRDVSDEKLSWLVEQLLDGELAAQQAIIIWCRWRRERERLASMLKNIAVTQIHGGQSQKEREMHIKEFQTSSPRRVVMLAQPHAGGFGLNLAAASTAVFLSNDFSHTTRVQAEDRIHRIGQQNACLYVDVVAVGPRGQRTVDHHVLETLRGKKDLAEMTTRAWRKVL